MEEIAIGIEIATMVTRDRDAVDFLMKKFQQAVNQKAIEIHFALPERRKYLDYIDISESQRNSDLRMEVSRHKYG